MILIDTLRVSRGSLPPRVLGLVLEWAYRHRPELGDVWRQAERHGAEGEVSLKHLVGKGIFGSWEDEGEFLKVTVDPESGTVSWPGGIDLAPDSLYGKITGASQSTSNPAPQSF